MTIDSVIKKYNLNDSFLLGFYGAGNYGDELLLEVLQTVLAKHHLKNISFLYQRPNTRATFHHDLGYQPVNAHSKFAVIKTILSKKTIVVGGGGLWGMDINMNVFFMSFMLLFARFGLGKTVLLVGVGYYGSTSRLGHAGAWCAGKAANFILARDQETLTNFTKINSNTQLGKDIAWSLPNLDISPYQSDADQLEKRLSITSGTLFISLRHFKPGFKQSFDAIVESTIAKNPDRTIIIALMEPKSVDPLHWQQLERWADSYDNVQIIDFSFNPIALYLFFKKHRRHLTYIGPQFHAILTAHLAGVPFMPISYDNKVEALLNDLGISDILPIHQVEPIHVEQFLTANLAESSI